MAIAVVDRQIEAITAACFDVAFLVEGEELGIGFGSDAETPEITLVGDAAGCREGEAVPVRFIGQVLSRPDEAAFGLERRLAGRCTRPGRPVLALCAPVQAQLQKIGREHFLCRRFRILKIG